MSSTFDVAYEGARGTAMKLPTWMLRRWEGRVARQLSSGTPVPGARARLLAIRGVIRDRRNP